MTPGAATEAVPGTAVSPAARRPAFVPSTRAAILANAVSREVEVSSANGENPQSSQVPSRSAGRYFAAVEHPVADLLRRLDPRVDRVDHADEDPLVLAEVVAR